MLETSRTLRMLAVALALGVSVLVPERLLRHRESPPVSIEAPPSSTQTTEWTPPLVPRQDTVRQAAPIDRTPARARPLLEPEPVSPGSGRAADP